MNSDSNLAAWMIAGGHLIPAPAIERDRDHRRALESARQAAAGPSLSARITAAFASFRAPRIETEPACCPA